MCEWNCLVFPPLPCNSSSLIEWLLSETQIGFHTGQHKSIHKFFIQLYLSVSFLSGSYMSISESWETPPNNCRVSALHLFGFRCWNKSLKTIDLSRRVFHLVDGLHIWYDVLQEQALSSSCHRLISLNTVSLTFQPILHEQKSLSIRFMFMSVRFMFIFALLLHVVFS